MELPDETIEYQYSGLIAPTASDAFTPLAELQKQNFLSPAKLKALIPTITQVRGQVAAERNLTAHPATDNFAAWSPDSRKIAFISNRDGGHDVYVMDVK